MDNINLFRSDVSTELPGVSTVDPEIERLNAIKEKMKNGYPPTSEELMLLNKNKTPISEVSSFSNPTKEQSNAGRFASSLQQQQQQTKNQQTPQTPQTRFGAMGAPTTATTGPMITSYPLAGDMKKNVTQQTASPTITPQGIPLQPFTADTSITPKKITPFSKKAENVSIGASLPTNISTSAGLTVDQNTLQKPLSGEEIKDKWEDVKNFFGSNPDGFTLANVLDAVGTAFSAKGGNFRETMLQQRKKAQLANQLQMQQNKQLFTNQQDILKQQLLNKIAEMDKEIIQYKLKGQVDLANAKELEKAKMINELEMYPKKLAASAGIDYWQKGGAAAAGQNYVRTGVEK